ncbi:uncharacterized protein LOC111692197 [Anoplophora glabripennis]|uniref:uncharacterized protein LOC111692197 n=1 Tax=Anoplophora glabripennis TaxID=217634 RepID=UPI000C792EE5|nr:uncharacterized protein LOC111692197 [Anoplophora glabripennis]
MEDDFWEFFNYVEDVDGFLPVPRILLRDNSNPFERYTNSELIQRIRFSRDTIETTVLPMVYHNIRDGDNRGLPVPPALKLYVALRFFATGSYQQVYADVATISQSSVCRIVREISEELKLLVIIKQHELNGLLRNWQSNKINFLAPSFT